MGTPLPTVLVAIDDPVFRLDVESAFSDAGYRVVPAARAPAPRQQIALAVIDFDPPKEDSFTLIRTMRRRKTPVVVLTSDKDTGRQGNGYVRIAKPVSTTEMVLQLTRDLLGGGVAGSA
jgi:DNA-binding response OmpR family regulator